MDSSLVAKPVLSKLSLEKYAAICVILKGGHDLATSIPLGELKEVARVSGITTKGKNSRAEMLQRLTSCNLSHAYITDEDPQSESQTMPPPLEAGDLTALLWAAPSAGLAKGVVSAQTLMDFAGIPANQPTAPSTSLPQRFLSDLSGACQPHHHPHASQPRHAPPYPTPSQHQPSSQATHPQFPPLTFSQAPPPSQLAATQPPAFPSGPASQQPHLTQCRTPSHSHFSTPSHTAPPGDQPLHPHPHFPPISQPIDAPQPHSLPQRPPAAAHMTADQPQQEPHPPHDFASQQQPAYHANSSSMMQTHARAQALLQLQSGNTSQLTSLAAALPPAPPHPLAGPGAPQATYASTHSPPHTASAHPQRPLQTWVSQQAVTVAAPHHPRLQPHTSHHQLGPSHPLQPHPAQHPHSDTGTGDLHASPPAPGLCPTAERPEAAHAGSGSTPHMCGLHELPRWLLEDTAEIAQTSSAAAVRLEVALQRRRVAVCFTEDTDVDVECGGRTRTHFLKQGVYDGRVIEVHADVEHAEGTCEEGCGLRHRFCTVKLAVPQKGRASVAVLMWIDLAPQLQADSFTAFLHHADDAWMLLDAGTSEELPQLRATLAAQPPSPPAPTRRLQPPPPSAAPGRLRGRPKSSGAHMHGAPTPPRAAPAAEPAPKKAAGADGHSSRRPPAPQAQRGKAAQESSCRRSRRLSGHAAMVDEPRRSVQPIPQVQDAPTPTPVASVRPVHVPVTTVPLVLQQETALGQSSPARAHWPDYLVGITQQEPNITQQRPRREEAAAQHATSMASRQCHSLERPAGAGDGVAGAGSCAVAEPKGGGEHRAQHGSGMLAAMPREVREGSGGAAGSCLPVQPGSGSSHFRAGPHLGPGAGGGNSCPRQQGSTMDSTRRHSGESRQCPREGSRGGAPATGEAQPADVAQAWKPPQGGGWVRVKRKRSEGPVTAQRQT